MEKYYNLVRGASSRSAIVQSDERNSMQKKTRAGKAAEAFQSKKLKDNS
jgi:hypothetical protein